MRYRFANKDDANLILDFVKQLAIYEKMENEVVASPELLEEWIFDRSLGAVSLDEWMIFRLTGDTLNDLCRDI